MFGDSNGEGQQRQHDKLISCLMVFFLMLVQHAVM